MNKENKNVESEELNVKESFGYKCGEWLLGAFTLSMIMLMAAGTAKVILWMLF